ITFGISCAAFTRYGRKTREHLGFFAYCREDLGTGIAGNVMGDGKGTESPEPLACIRRSGITSRTKFASFSFSHKSCASTGPRAPAVMLFWLSVTGAPKAVVRWETGHFLGSWLIVFLQ